MAKLSLITIPVSVTIILFYSGCQYRDVNGTNERLTLSRLSAAGTLVKECRKMGIDFGKYHSWDDCLLDLVEKDLLDKEEYKSTLRVDAWGRPFRMKVSELGGETIILVISDGADGKPQDGGGDNLFVEVKTVEGGETRIRLSRLVAQ